jgi:hypothetical protein
MNITFSDTPEHKMNTDYTWSVIISYYYFLFWFVGGTSSVLYFVLWLQELSMDYPDSDTDSDSDADSQVETEPKNFAYENEMFEEYDNLEDRELTEEYVKDLSLNTITETTPRGDVLTYYDSDLESFVYYSKTKEIPYKYLETVARKYVINYDCKRIYIDIRKEYEKGVNKCKDIKEKEKANAEQTVADIEANGANKKRQLFVKLKSYNRKAEVNNKQKDKIYILREKSNRFSYRGKIEEYKEAVSSECENTNDTNDTDNTESAIDKKTMDFSAFKKFKSL